MEAVVVKVSPEIAAAIKYLCHKEGITSQEASEIIFIRQPKSLDAAFFRRRYIKRKTAYALVEKRFTKCT